MPIAEWVNALQPSIKSTMLTYSTDAQIKWRANPYVQSIIENWLAGWLSGGPSVSTEAPILATSSKNEKKPEPKKKPSSSSAGEPMNLFGDDGGW